MSPKVAGFILYKILGWKPAPGEGVAAEKCCIILAAPHTSIWDFVVGWLYYRSVGGKMKVMIKKEAFFFPLGPILRAMGGFPVDRGNSQQLVRSIIDEMKATSGTFHLVICPEGTRKPVRKWKTGYHTIARAAGVPVYLSHYDFAAKVLGTGHKVELTDNARSDTDRIQQIYEDMHLTALHPEQFITH